MPRLFLAVLVVLAAALAATGARVGASGPVGIYGVIEKVVFEPNETAPDRIQVWGAFAYVNDWAPAGLGTSPAARGYLYFRLPAIELEGLGDKQTIRREWADLEAVAGTGQAVAFGRWGFIGAFRALNPTTRPNGPPYILEATVQGGAQTDLRVRPASESPSAPTTYQTNAGVVKIGERGSHAALVKELRAALTR